MRNTSACPSASLSARALAWSGRVTPSDMVFRDAYPAIQTGPLGVMSTAATPADHPAAPPSARPANSPSASASAASPRLALDAFPRMVVPPAPGGASYSRPGSPPQDVGPARLMPEKTSAGVDR